jgi:hypothetical protein
MATFFSELLLSLLLALGLAVPGAPHGSAATVLSPAAAADEKAGNFDPNGLTVTSSQEDEKAGNFDPDGLTATSSQEDERGGNPDPDGAV